jgi:hypothetical protein
MLASFPASISKEACLRFPNRVMIKIYVSLGPASSLRGLRASVYEASLLIRLHGQASATAQAAGPPATRYSITIAILCATHVARSVSITTKLPALGNRSELGSNNSFFRRTKMSKSMLPAKPVEMPDEFRRFFDLPAVVRAEKLEDFFDFFNLIANAVKPIDIFDWIWVDDFVVAEWDIRLDRRIKRDIIKLKEEEHITECKREAEFNRYRIDMLHNRMLAEAEAENPGDLKRQTKKKDAQPEVVETEEANIEDPYLLAKVFMRYGNEIDLVEKRISAGEKKRDGILREIYRRRESLARKLEKASSDIIDAEFTEE